MLEQLIHNGVIVPDPPDPLGLSIVVRGERIELSPKQEEMALAFARKAGTPYVEDEVFGRNFLTDLAAEMGIETPGSLAEVDLSACDAVVAEERERKAALTKEERKALAAERRAKREALKAKFGYAIVNGQRVELGAYTAEPSGIFMGRGEHPLRGRWKEGASPSDITLNLSPGAPRPAGDWGEIVWQPESMWVARWWDRLSEKIKYVWLSDTAPLKQEREAAKLRRSLRGRAINYLRKARKAYQRSLDAGATLGEAASDRWRVAATRGLRSVEDLLRGRE